MDPESYRKYNRLGLGLSVAALATGFFLNPYYERNNDVLAAISDLPNQLVSYAASLCNLVIGDGCFIVPSVLAGCFVVVVLTASPMV